MLRPPLPTPEEIELVRKFFAGGGYFEALNVVMELDRRFEREAESDSKSFALLDPLRSYPEFRCTGALLVKHLSDIPHRLLELAFECAQARIALRVIHEFKTKFIPENENL